MEDLPKGPRDTVPTTPVWVIIMNRQSIICGVTAVSFLPLGYSAPDQRGLSRPEEVHS